MSLVNRAFFVGEINIPNSNQSSIGEVIDMFIQQYELDYLTNVLGYDLFKDFMAGLSAPVVEDRWTKLLYGSEYVDCNRTFRYRGLIEKPAYSLPNLVDGDIEMVTVDDQTAVLKSPIAYYVYFKFALNQASMSTTMGEVKPTAENAQLSSPAVKLANAWNQMSERTKELISYLTNQISVYPTWHSQHAYALLCKTRPINTLGI